MQYENEMTLQFQSKSENEAFARVVAATFVSQLNPTISDIADIKTAVSEAVTNAIIHGYENKEGIVVIDVINQGIHHRIAQKLLHKPKTSHISLDKYGSVLWKAIDGRNTVYDILNIMSDTFPDEKDSMLNRVIAFMQTLKRNNFILVPSRKKD